MTKFIINADDFGLSNSVNKGIVEAMTQGIVSSTTIMMNMPKSSEALKLAEKYNINAIGIHLNLTKGKSVLPASELPLITHSDGTFKDIRKTLITTAMQQEIIKEFEAQIKKALAAGLRPTHLDSHHHVHMLTGVKDCFIAVAKKYKLPTRGFSMNEEEQVNNQSYILNTKFYDRNVSEDNLLTILQSNFKGIIEIMTHPGFVDGELKDISIYNNQRQQELTILTSDNLKNYISRNNIKIISFQDI